MSRVNLTPPESLPVPFLAAEPWMIDSIRIDRDGDMVRVDMSGWAFPDPELGASSRGRFLINGRPFEEIHYPVDREEVGKIFWQRKNARYSGFRCLCSGPLASIYTKDGAIELTYMNPGPRREVPAQQSWFIYDCEREASPFPGESRRFRVIGSNDLNSFRLGGFTDFKRLDAAAVTLTGKGFAGYARVLDWGCGCGRVARYASRLPEIAFTGCDIDGDNVAWCAKHLGGSFAATRIHPPLPFDAARFDFVYGVSVFTHLDTRFQDAWLDELQRVTAPGALLLVTTHGTTALDYAGLNPTDYQTLRTCIEGQGLYVSGHNTQIEGYSEDAGEYVNVFHDASYIRRHWGQWFDILSILPGYLYTHDLVVMRKRA